jgi:hypothetical protein
MRKITILSFFMGLCFAINAQDSTNFEAYDPSQYEDGASVRKFCTQKVINQTPTKLYGIGYEHNFGFKSSSIMDPSHNISGMGGLRINTSLLAISKNNFILSLGLNSWSSKIRSSYTPIDTNMLQVYRNRMDAESFNVLAFKPLNEKNFIIVQANIDMSTIDNKGDWAFTKSGLTFYGSAMYGWKKGDYRMLAIGVSRTYRMGRPLIVPILLYNKTFNEHWGLECLFPARAHLRYNFSTNSMLLAGYELEGQQFDLVNSNKFLQRGEIKPRLVFEKKLKGYFWLSAQAGYRINGRFNLVDKYDGQEKDEVLKNNWGNSPFINIGINLVSP